MEKLMPKNYKEIPREELVTPENIRKMVKRIFTEAENSTLLVPDKYEIGNGITCHEVSLLGIRFASYETRGGEPTGSCYLRGGSGEVPNYKERILKLINGEYVDNIYVGIPNNGLPKMRNIKEVDTEELRKIAEAFGL